MTAYALGMLDWGIGGLGCYRLLRARFPAVSIVYCSDTGAVPYGRLPRAALRARVALALDFLVRAGARQLIVACNAASTVLPALALETPCLGVIESALAMVPADLAGSLGVLGGARTIRAGIYQRKLTRPGLRVRGRVAQPLSAHIEAGTTRTGAFAAELARVMAPLRDADAILWACTHYPAVADAFRPLAPGAQWLDPAAALVEDVARRFTLDEAGHTRIVTTGSAAAMQAAAQTAWGLRLPGVEQVSLGGAP